MAKNRETDHFINNPDINDLPLKTREQVDTVGQHPALKKFLGEVATNLRGYVKTGLESINHYLIDPPSVKTGDLRAKFLYEPTEDEFNGHRKHLKERLDSKIDKIETSDIAHKSPAITALSSGRLSIKDPKQEESQKEIEDKARAAYHLTHQPRTRRQEKHARRQYRRLMKNMEHAINRRNIELIYGDYGDITGMPELGTLARKSAIKVSHESRPERRNAIKANRKYAHYLEEIHHNNARIDSSASGYDLSGIIRSSRLKRLRNKGKKYLSDN